MDYIKESGIAAVVTQALGHLYRTQPKFPLDCLAKWFQNYCESNEYRERLAFQEKKEAEDKGVWVQKCKEEQKRVEAEEKLRNQNNLLYENLLKTISSTEYHRDLLFSRLSEEIMSRVPLTGAYVGFYDFPLVEMEEADTNEIGHLNLDAPKVIRYVGGDPTSYVLLA